MLFTAACAEEDEPLASEAQDPAAASASPDEATVASPPGPAGARSFLCGWQTTVHLYDKPNFKGYNENWALAACRCETVSPWFVDHLYSASTGTPAEVCWFYTGRNCTGASQCVDNAGYRNMASLPAYHSIYCTRLEDGARSRCP